MFRAEHLHAVLTLTFRAVGRSLVAFVKLGRAERGGCNQSANGDVQRILNRQSLICKCLHRFVVRTDTHPSQAMQCLATDMASAHLGLLRWNGVTNMEATMKKRIIYSALILTALLVLGYFSPHLYWTIRGTVGGEAFYAGKPTTYWRGVAAIPGDETAIIEMPVGLVAAPNSSWCKTFDDWKRQWFFVDVVGPWRDLLTDRDAIPVVRELFHDEDEAIRAFAVSACAGMARRPAASCRGCSIMRERATIGVRSRESPTIYPESAELNCCPRCAIGLMNPRTLPNSPTWQLPNTCAAADGAELEKMTPRLIQNLGGSHGDRLGRMFYIIGKNALPALQKELKSDNAVMRRNATSAVGWLQSEECPSATALLIGQLRDPDPQVRCMAAKSLGGATPTNFDAVCASLRAYCDDSDVNVRAAALFSLVIRASGHFYMSDRHYIEHWLRIAERENHADLRDEAARGSTNSSAAKIDAVVDTRRWLKPNSENARERASRCAARPPLYPPSTAGRIPLRGKPRERGWLIMVRIADKITLIDKESEDETGVFYSFGIRICFGFRDSDFEFANSLAQCIFHFAHRSFHADQHRARHDAVADVQLLDAGNLRDRRGRSRS